MATKYIKKTPKKDVYRARVGMNYRGKRVEAGELVDDLPEESVEWLLRDGHIEKVEDE